MRAAVMMSAATIVCANASASVSYIAGVAAGGMTSTNPSNAAGTQVSFSGPVGGGGFLVTGGGSTSGGLGGTCANPQLGASGAVFEISASAPGALGAVAMTGCGHGGGTAQNVYVDAGMLLRFGLDEISTFDLTVTEGNVALLRQVGSSDVPVQAGELLYPGEQFAFKVSVSMNSFGQPGDFRGVSSEGTLVVTPVPAPAAASLVSVLGAWCATRKRRSPA